MEFCWLVKLIVKLKYRKELLDYLSIKDPYSDFFEWSGDGVKRNTW